MITCIPSWLAFTLPMYAGFLDAQQSLSLSLSSGHSFIHEICNLHPPLIRWSLHTSLYVCVYMESTRQRIWQRKIYIYIYTHKEEEKTSWAGAWARVAAAARLPAEHRGLVGRWGFGWRRGSSGSCSHARTHRIWGGSSWKSTREEGGMRGPAMSLLPGAWRPSKRSRVGSSCPTLTSTELSCCYCFCVSQTSSQSNFISKNHIFYWSLEYLYLCINTHQ